MAAKKKAPIRGGETQEDKIKSYCDKNNIAYDILTAAEKQTVIDALEDEEMEDDLPLSMAPQPAANAPRSAGVDLWPVIALYHFKDVPTMIYIGSDKAAAFDALIAFGDNQGYDSRHLKVDYAK